MSNVTHYYLGYAEEGQWLRQVAAELGMTPRQFIESDLDIDSYLLSYSIPEEGRLTAEFRGGLTMDVTYQPSPLVVTHVSVMFNGQLAVEWTGTMNAEQFLEDAWPEEVVYGHEKPEWLAAVHSTLYAGAGDDIIEIWGNSMVHGQGGKDFFVIDDNNGQMTIADYQLGEKLYFANYENLEELAEDFIDVTNNTSSGFTLNFGRHGPHWSLTIHGASLEQMRLEDFLVGDPVGLVGVAPEIRPFLQAVGYV